MCVMVQLAYNSQGILNKIAKKHEPNTRLKRISEIRVPISKFNPSSDATVWVFFCDERCEDFVPVFGLLLVLVAQDDVVRNGEKASNNHAI